MKEENEYVECRLEGEAVSSPALICQVSGIPDSGMEFNGEVPFCELGIESDDRFMLAAPLRFSLHVALAKQDIVVTGCLDADVEAICDRCAEPAPLHLHVCDVLHTYKNVLGQPVDLTEDIREDILLAFPQTFHCSDDCKGLCPMCGHNLNDGPCSCKSQEDGEEWDGNPWEALDGLGLK